MQEGFCSKCSKFAGTLHLDHADGIFKCRHCVGVVGDSGISLVVRGVANPADPEASTAHVKDIQDRRWHPTEKRTFYWSKEKPKSYFFPKG